MGNHSGTLPSATDGEFACERLLRAVEGNSALS